MSAYIRNDKFKTLCKVCNPTLTALEASFAFIEVFRPRSERDAFAERFDKTKSEILTKNLYAYNFLSLPSGQSMPNGCWLKAKNSSSRIRRARGSTFGDTVRCSANRFL